MDMHRSIDYGDREENRERHSWHFIAHISWAISAGRVNWPDQLIPTSSLGAISPAISVYGPVLSRRIGSASGIESAAMRRGVWW